MARSKRARSARARQIEQARSRRGLLSPAIGLLALVVAAAVLASVALLGDEGTAPVAEPGPVHVHGLGINPADGALFIATHTGLFRAAEDDLAAARVGESFQDTMGFTVVGPDRFLGSGHPDRAGVPPLLGLIESTDAGRTWEPVSLLGEADFHALRFAHGRVYGYDVANDRLLTSRDQGRAWDELVRPGPIVDLAVDPADPRHLVAASETQLGPALFESRDGGAAWRQTASRAGLLAWPATGRLYVVTRGGEVLVTSDLKRFELRGHAGGDPAALLADEADIYVALHDGTVVRSGDGGKSWAVRSAP